MVPKQEKKSIERKLFSPQRKVPATKSDHDEDMMADDFDSDSETSLDITCNVVSVLPREYDQVMEVKINGWNRDGETQAYVLLHHEQCCVEEQNAFFERPDESMRSHLKPLFIRGKLGNVGVSKILVDGGAEVIVMLYYMLKRFDKDDTDTKPHNMVLSNYEGKVRTTLGVI